MPKAQHPKAASFVRQNLFTEVKSFAELETRIAELPDEQSRGDAFEVFAEAYLATQRKHDATNVWPLVSVPTQVLQTLGLAAKDYGVDGVIKTMLGHFNAYQVKFRTNRPALTWRELSTFMGLADSPQIRSRVLLTNCDDLPSVLNERQGFFCIRGSDLDRLEADDFRTIEAWMEDAAFEAPKKQPQPHQNEALDALLPALETHDRVSAIMACGTGKTLVALWVAERRRASLILVLVPSLSLQRQTLHEWLRETSLPSLAYLCVGSDTTVKNGLDSISTTQTDLDFQVSTDPASVRDFLDATFSGTKIIFSTYQSARVVGAALKPGEVFDLAVFDEAHKTAGREGRNFAFALEDANLPISKRLFLTATPRHYNPHTRDNEGEAKLVFSMDNPQVYGRQHYRLGFGEAARRGIICPYKIIISVITGTDITNELLERGDVLIEGDHFRARHMANQIALRDAVNRFGVCRIFTFHRTVNEAASFVGESGAGIQRQLSGFNTYHVNGNMTSARRERLMRDFRQSEKALMSNARCLTEGVDIPSVDMVAFLSPKRSLVDIVQATGRAMRNAPGKRIGYVLVPIFVEQEQGETVESAVARADFNHIWDVLQHMMEHDDALADEIGQIAETKGRTGALGHLAPDRIEFVGNCISVTTLEESIKAHCFDELLPTWDVRYGELVEFKIAHSHCQVPSSRKGLYGWLQHQQRPSDYRQTTIDRVAKLATLGLQWAVDWLSELQKRFDELEAYKIEHGHCRIHARFQRGQKPDFGLKLWVGKLQRFYMEGRIAPSLLEKLEAIGFEWPTSRSGGKKETKTRWQGPPSHLLGLATETANKMMPLRTLESQELEMLLRTLESRELVEMQQAIKSGEVSWDRCFAELESFKLEHGHCRVPPTYGNNKLLGVWVKAQRELYAKHDLTPDRVAKLSALGFVLDTLE